MADRPETVLQTKFFYAGSIFTVSLGLVTLMWRFKTVNWILVVFGLAWIVVVTAFAWDIVTRAERLESLVGTRTNALEETNRNLNALLNRLSAFQAISSQMNQQIESTDIARAVAERLTTALPGVHSVWLWLDPGLLEEEPETRDAESGPVPLNLVAQAGRSFGVPDALDPLRPDFQLAVRCFEDANVDLDHNLQAKARAWGWRWLVGSGMESFAGFPLQLGGRLLGVLGIFSAQTITAEFVSQLQQSVNQLTVALEKTRLLKETRRRAAELAAANAELRQLDSMKDWFVSSVSHELRTPLTNIRSFSEILEDYADLSPEERSEFAGVIRQESERLTDIINDVLDLAKISTSEIDLRPDYMDLGGLVEKCCKTFSQEAEERDITFQHQIAESVAQVWADQKGVARVLNNLIGNAFKFTLDGGEVRILVGPQPEDDGEFVTVMVTDTGVGIDAKDHAKVFEKFTQVGTGLHDKPPGTGIGLTICRQIVEQSNGRIWVDSAPHKGSTFGFTLPLRPAA